MHLKVCIVKKNVLPVGELNPKKKTLTNFQGFETFVTNSYEEFYHTQFKLFLISFTQRVFKVMKS